MKNAAALVLLASALAGCSLISPKAPADQAKADRFDCEVEAVVPIAGSVLDAAQLMRDVYAGKADLRSVLALTGSSAEDAAKLISELRKCKSKLVTPGEPEAESGAAVEEL